MSVTPKMFVLKSNWGHYILFWLHTQFFLNIFLNIFIFPLASIYYYFIFTLIKIKNKNVSLTTPFHNEQTIIILI